MLWSLSNNCQHFFKFCFSLFELSCLTAPHSGLNCFLALCLELAMLLLACSLNELLVSL